MANLFYLKGIVLENTHVEARVKTSPVNPISSHNDNI